MTSRPPAPAVDDPARDDMLRVFLADDHAVLRDGLAALIEAQPGMTVVGSAADGEGAVEGCRATRPDLAVVDLTMPGMTGLEAIEQIVALRPRVHVLVLTMHDDPRYLRAALDAGASGYVVKRSAGREIVAAITEVHEGRGCMSVSAATLHAAVGGGDVEPEVKVVEPHDALSKRELQVLELLALGYTNKEIANELGLATKSVDTYRQRLQDKLGLRGRALLVRYALDHGILEVERVGPQLPA